MKKKEGNYNYRNIIHVFLAEVISRPLVCFAGGTGLVHSRKVVYKAFASSAKCDDHENQVKVQNFTKLKEYPSP